MLGFEIGLLDEKISIEADYFKKTTTDILVQLHPLVPREDSAPFEKCGEMNKITDFEFIVKL